jgi:hypothetical protein
MKKQGQTILICRWHDLIAKRPKRLPDTVNSFSEVADTKSTYKNQ